MVVSLTEHYLSSYVVVNAGRVTLFAEGCRGSLSEVYINELLCITLSRVSLLGQINSGTVD